jgi:hypothetical protein
VDVFDWQETVRGLLSAPELEVELAAAEGRVRSAVERGLVAPDHVLTLGDRKYYYFAPQRIEEIRAALSLPKVDDASIRELFLGFVARMDMSSSYKLILLHAILGNVDEHGRARVDDVARAFRAFYLDRQEWGAPVERPGMRMQSPEECSLDDVRSIMLSMPFRKF